MIGRLRSLRVRVFLVVIAVVIVTLLFSWLGDTFSAGTSQRMTQELSESAKAIARLLGADPRFPLDTQVAARLDALGRSAGVHVRIITADGGVIYEGDHEAEPSLLERIGILLFGPGSPPTLRAFESGQPPLLQRLEIQEAWRTGRAQGCDIPVGEYAPRRLHLFCHAALRVDASPPFVIFVQKSERRIFRSLRNLRFQLVKLTFLVLVMGGFLGWWLGWRMVLPIEALRAQVMERAVRPESTFPISLQRRDEFEALARAFNDLLKALAERSRANEAFIADLVHEMKNPVAAIRACAERMGGEGALDEARAHRLARILRDSSSRLDMLVTCFLDLARAEAGLPNEERMDIDLKALLMGLIESQQASERYPTVHFTLSGSSAFVHGVAGRLESALRNILDNAASFSEPNGQVSVDIGSVQDQIEVTIRDTGPGIASDDLHKIFDRFFTTRAGQRGTGLGLPLSRAIIEAHGGTILAASPPGAGATFTIVLPGIKRG